MSKGRASAASKTRVMRAFAEAVLGQRQGLYKRTHNPVHIWHAYVSARKIGVALPLWVLRYLDQVAAGLTAPQGPRSPKTIAAALGLATRGGPARASQAKTDERDLDIASRVWALQNYARAHPGQDPQLNNLLGIQVRVAEEYQLSVDRVQAIHRRVMEMPPPQHQGTHSRRTNSTSS